MNQLRKIYFLIWMILSIVLLIGFTNTNLPIDKEDQKKLEKAKKLNQEAQELYDKANVLFSEIADLDISNPKNEKKVNSLKEKALDHQINALELQKEANYLEYNVFNRIKPELKSNYIKTHDLPSMIQLLEESANE
jgi:shikimate kinase